MAIDYGRAEIAAFKQGASSGQITFDPQAVTDVVRVYDNLIDGLITERANIMQAIRVTGFGGLDSAQSLANGFSNKAQQYADNITEFVEGAMRLQEAYLIAGGKLEEADQKNAQALSFLSRSSEGESQ